MPHRPIYLTLMYKIEDLICDTIDIPLIPLSDQIGAGITAPILENLFHIFADPRTLETSPTPTSERVPSIPFV